MMTSQVFHIEPGSFSCTYNVYDGGGHLIARDLSREQATLFVAAPALLDIAVYFNHASNPINNYEDLDDDAYVTITVTVRAIRDCRQAIKEATP